MTIQNLNAHEILDSKNHPTIEAMVTLDDGSTHIAASPSGASTGTNEAIELPVPEALEQIKTRITPALIGKDPANQQALDDILIALDGTKNKSVLGGNATTAISMALLKAGAHTENIPLYTYIQKLTNTKEVRLPVPLFLVMEGGKHGNWATDIQEFMVVPNAKTYPTFASRLAVCNRVFAALETLLQEKKYSLTIGFEGAFCPNELSSNEEALSLITQAIQKAGVTPGIDMHIAIDAAASEFFDNNTYILKSEDNKILTPDAWTNQILAWTKTYPIFSFEDMYDEEDWDSWIRLTAALGTDHLVIGDDLVTTNVALIQKAIDRKAINSVLIKVNQIGTISETFAAIALSHKAGYTTVVSHRGGETLDDTIADIAVGTASYSKFGGPRRPERMAKYNRLLAIEETLNNRPNP